MSAGPRLACWSCQGEGTDCRHCDGSGDLRCSCRGCDEVAIGFNDDGDAMCEDCMAEWMSESFGLEAPDANAK